MQICFATTNAYRQFKLLTSFVVQQGFKHGSSNQNVEM